MIPSPVIPWILGMLGFAVGFLIVGNSVWLCAFAVVPIIIGYVVIWP